MGQEGLSKPVTDTPIPSNLKIGQKVLLGDNSFGIIGAIAKINPKDKKQIKINANLGVEFSVAIADFNKSWKLLD